MSRIIAIPSLTGLRGVAAAWVFLTHVYPLAATLLIWPGLMDCTFLYNGFRGVDLFFILSGFILMHVHAQEFRAFDKNLTLRFFILRFFRIYPINAVILLLLVPLVLACPGFVAASRAYTDPHFAYRAHNYSFAGFIQSLLLVQTWTFLKLGEWNIVAWTLSAEVLGYLLFPFIAWLLMRDVSVRRCLVAAIVSLSLLSLILWLAHHADNNPTGIFGAVRMAFCFFAGACLHRCYQLWGDKPARCAPVIILASIGFVALTMFWPLAPLFDCFGFAGIIFGLAYQRGSINRLLSSRVALFAGKISFSFYLTHYLLITLFTWAFAQSLHGEALAIRMAALGGLTCFCLLFSTVTYYFIEKPFQKTGRVAAAKWATK